MSNEQALNSLLRWWRSIPSFRRPGHEQRFRLSRSEAEVYILDLREKWSRCGKAVLKLCVPRREALERDARLATQDLLAWIDSAESVALQTCSHNLSEGKARIKEWATRWRAALGRCADSPLAESPGATLGTGPESTLLTNFRWWGNDCHLPTGPGGPLSDFPLTLVEPKDDGPPIRLSSHASVNEVLLEFPGSVNELQLSICRSPWTAAFALNWLLSTKGILRPSRRAPEFDGPSAVPMAREWLDQLSPAFSDWHVSKFEGRRNAGTKTSTESGLPSYVGRAFKSPVFSAAINQIGNPLVPSAYVVPPGVEALIVNEKGHKNPLDVGSGQCVVFEFLLSRLEELESQEFGLAEDLAGPPSIRIVDGDRRGTVAVQVGASSNRVNLPKGGVTLLYSLGKNGMAHEVLASRVKAIRDFVPEVAAFLESGKKQKNYYTFCKAEKLRGQVLWGASIVPPIDT